MKKLLFVTLLLTNMLLTVGQKVQYKGMVFSITKEFKAILIDGKNVTGEILIPEFVVYNNTKYPVTEIGKSAFEKNINIERVEIPESVLKINKKAFGNCKNLDFIILPKSIAEICDYSFEYCPNLKVFSKMNNPNVISKSSFLNYSDGYGRTNVILYYPYEFSVAYQNEIPNINEKYPFIKEYKSILGDFPRYRPEDSFYIQGQLVNRNEQFLENVRVNGWFIPIDSLSMFLYDLSIECDNQTPLVNLELKDSCYANDLFYLYDKNKNGKYEGVIMHEELNSPKPIYIHSFYRDIEWHKFDTLKLPARLLIGNIKPKVKKVIVSKPQMKVLDLNFYTAGELKNYFSQNMQNLLVTNLTLHGKINWQDIEFIKSYLISLESLDLSKIDFENADRNIESNDNDFYNICSLKKLYLPNKFKLFELDRFKDLRILQMSDSTLFYLNGSRDGTDKILLPKTLTTLIVTTDSGKVTYRKTRSNLGSPIKIENMNINLCRKLIDYQNLLSYFNDKDMIIDRINYGENVLSIEDSIDVIHKLNKRIFTIIYNDNIKNINFNDLMYVGFDFLNDYTYYPEKELLQNNIWRYYSNMLKSYDTDLKRSNFMKTDKYNKLNYEFICNRSLYSDLPKFVIWPRKILHYSNNSYFPWNLPLNSGFHTLYSISDYNINDGSFTIWYNMELEERGQEKYGYPKNLFIFNNSVFIQFPSIPTISKGEQYFYNPVSKVYDYKYKSYFKIYVDNKNAEKIENNKYNLDIYFIFKNIKIGNIYTYKGGDDYQLDLFSSNNVRMIMVNHSTNEIYYDHFFDNKQ